MLEDDDFIIEIDMTDDEGDFDDSVCVLTLDECRQLGIDPREIYRIDDEWAGWVQN